jgi:phosphoglycolate phosphatase
MDQPPTRSQFRADAVLFDLDGTLVHTAPDIAESVQCMLADLGRPTVDQPTVETWIGDGVGRLVHRALTGERERDAEPALFERGYARFLAHYGQLVSHRSRPYPGIREGLRSLAEQKVPLACITSKMEVFTLALLRDLELAPFFEVVVSGDSLPRRKPDPLPVLHACSRLGVDPAHAVLVGDSANDARAARAAGSAFVAVSYGYNGGQPASTLGADLVIDSLEELLPHLEAHVRV